MSLITACPACQTQFEVNDEQLQAYAGKVRCGECNHVFDARASMVEALEETQTIEATEPILTTEPPAPVESIEPAESVALSESVTADSADASSPYPQYERAEADIPTVELTGAEVSRFNAPEVDGSNAHSSETDSSETGGADTGYSPAVTLDSPTAELDAPLTTLDDAAEKTDQATTWNLEPEEGDKTAIPAFLRNVSFDDERLATPEKTAARWVFPLLSGLLVVTLLLQFIYFTRTSLAANYPFTKPLLQSACRMAHCAVPLPKDITQLTIDDADIQEHREREGVLVFSSVLINHGAVPQAYPMIELTLTNMADEPVLRKILSPKEYLPASSKTELGLTAQQEQPIKATLGIEEKAVTGFRVAIAY